MLHVLIKNKSYLFPGKSPTMQCPHDCGLGRVNVTNMLEVLRNFRQQNIWLSLNETFKEL